MKAKLSMAFEDLRGKDGNVVISKSRSGLICRPRVSPRNPKSNPQQFVRGNLTKAAQTFRNMTPAQVAVWNNYANGITRVNPISGESYHPTAIDVFVGLAAKFLQATPGGTIPLTPPTSAFTGETFTISATASAGKVTFTATAPNTVGVITELLLQPLASPNRKPQAGAYRSKQFYTFISGAGLIRDVSVPAGYYAAAYRFVKTSTGQDTEMVFLPVQTVTLSMEDGGWNEASAPAKQKKAA